MYFHYCPLCFFQAYPVISDCVPTDEYVCLTKNCGNFKISVSEYETFIDSWPEMCGEPEYPVWPLLDNGEPSPAVNQLYSAQPWPHEFTQQDPIPAPHMQYAIAAPQSAAAIPSSAPTPGATCAEPPKARGPSTGDRRRYKMSDIPRLEKPFSEMPIKEGSDPMIQITNHVNRSVEQRRRQAETDGMVKRPLNAFILYRKAYSDTAKQDNMMAISCLAAKSWAMESHSVRDEFKELAKIDRGFHEQAFPSYKFNPRRG